tara:strand:- start:16346 stop:16741 length:396 start_codon:yes stop_codon:yes gene_type:complete
MSRGIRNNNPGNIRHGIDWDGLDEDQSKDEEFSQFSTPEYGIRAMFKILKTYDNKYNLNTIEGIINRWAPPIENDTESYIDFVSSKVGKDRSEVLDQEDYILLVEAIIHMENGEQPYPLVLITAGRDLAYG